MFKFVYSSIVAVCIVVITGTVSVQAADVRTSGRSTTGETVKVRQGKFPVYLSPSTKKTYRNWSFNPKTDPQFYKYRHPQQWVGMDWDAELWPKGVSEETVLRKMYSAGVFNRQYVSKKQLPVVEVGPRFYKLSDLDKRRSLKLLAGYFEFFDSGFTFFEVRDWRESAKIGDYTRYGFQPE